MALITVTIVIAFVFAYAAYDLTGPQLAPAGGLADPGQSKGKRWASAATAFTSILVVLALVLPLLS